MTNVGEHIALSKHADDITTAINDRQPVNAIASHSEQRIANLVSGLDRTQVKIGIALAKRNSGILSVTHSTANIRIGENA